MKSTTLQFTGTTREYFGIWIVNLLLSIVTLGIYYPWAKVRYKKYFYQHTLLDEVGFDYHANPVTILKGWAIAITLFIVFQLASNFSIVANAIVSILLVFFTPWLVTRGMRFNARNSSYRGLRFNFNGSLAKATLYFVLLPSLLFITFGLAYPLIQQRMTRFKRNHYFYGTERFHLSASTSDFYTIYFKLVGLVIATYLIIGLSMTMFGPINLPDFETMLPTKTFTTFDGLGSLTTISSVLAIIAPYLLFFAFIKARTANLVWNTTTIAQFSFKSTQRARDIAWLYLTNTLSVIFTLGLATPWAQVRLARYRLEHLALVGETNWSALIGEQQTAVNAIGEEVADFFDIDIGL